MVHVLAELRIKEGKLDEFLEMFKELPRLYAEGKYPVSPYCGC